MSRRGRRPAAAVARPARARAAGRWSLAFCCSPLRSSASGASSDVDSPTGPHTATAALYTDASTGALHTRRYRVVVAKGPDAGKHVLFDAGTLIVGTHLDADLRLS